MLIQLYRVLAAFKTDREGVSALEYALMGAFIAVVIVSAVTGLGTNLRTTFTNISRTLP